MKQRVQQFRSSLASHGVDAFIVTFPPHVRYLSGFSGSNGMCVIGPKNQTFLTDGRYAEQSRMEVKGWSIVVSTGSLFAEIEKRRLVRPGWKVGIDGNTMVLEQYRLLKTALSPARVLPKVEAVESLAAIKDETEIAKIVKAVAITDAVFIDLLNIIQAGMTEIDLAAEITYRQRSLGADGDAFESIVVSGVRGALPHGTPSTKKLRRGELLTIDMGCIYQGYHSDMTRTVAIGKPSGELRKIYQTVLDAQCRAVDAARAQIKSSALDAVARDHISTAGYAKYFQHSLGHGVGLQIHENPRVSFASKATLETGNVITIEPGIYVPDTGGVRIEDIVVIRNGGRDVLTQSPKELIIL